MKKDNCTQAGNSIFNGLHVLTYLKNKCIKYLKGIEHENTENQAATLSNCHLGKVPININFGRKVEEKETELLESMSSLLDFGHLVKLLYYQN